MPELRRPSLEAVITFSVVAGAVIFTLFQLQPGLLVKHNTPSGGDMGAHVWGPAFMRDHLLPHWRITGWTPDWYSGFPAFTFYFPLPAVLIVLLDVVLPYGVAFKFVTVLGVLALPVCAYAFGRLAGMRFPGPAVLAVATVPFLFDRGFSIYGGNIASTLAGEFTFTISLALAMLFLGVVARGLDTGKHRALAAVLLAMTALCHMLPTIFAVVGALILLVLRPGVRRAKLVATVLVVGGLIAAFWSFPFLMRLPYANNMGWEKLPAGAKGVSPYLKLLFPDNLLWLQLLAGVAVVTSFVMKRRVGLFLVGMGTLAGALFVVAPESRLWNARVLPFWFLCLYLLAGVALAEAGPALGVLLAREPDNPSPMAALVTPVAVAVAAWVMVGLPLKVLPSLPSPRVLILFVAAAAVAAAGYRMVTGLALLATAAFTGVVHVLSRSRLGDSSLFGANLRDLRMLPLFKLALFLLAAVVLTELMMLLIGRARPHLVNFDAPSKESTPPPPASSVGAPRPVPWDRRLVQGGTPVVAALAASFLVAVPVGLAPRVFDRPTTTDSSFVPGWAKWNYTGYEGKAAYPEYKALVATMARVGREHGCGRANWEYESDENRFGTPMALMLLPYWTDSCIGSMEGLYFESSPTVPYHFLSAAELSKGPSNPQRDLPYRSLDVTAGIEHLQILGARYYMAFSPETVAAANANPALTHVATGPALPATATAGAAPRTWEIFQVAGSELVTPLEYEPAVMTGLGKGERDWMGPSVNWYMDREAHDVMLAASGPKRWGRVKVRAATLEESLTRALHRAPTPQEIDNERANVSKTINPKTVGSNVTVPAPARKPLPEVVVSRIRSNDDTISFDVDRPGTPVLVKTSYFPNWKASGADGPWRVAPNLMVVIPTSRHVSLHYGWTPVDATGWLLTLVGLGLAVGMARKGQMVLADRPRRSKAEAQADGGDEGRGEGESVADDVADPISATAAAEANPAHPPPLTVHRFGS